MLHTQPHQFERLLPTLPQPDLDALAEGVCRRKAFELKRPLHPETACAEQITFLPAST